MLTYSYRFITREGAQQFIEEASAETLKPLTDAKLNVVYSEVVGEEPEEDKANYRVEVTFEDSGRCAISAPIETPIKVHDKEPKEDTKDSDEFEWDTEKIKKFLKIAGFGLVCFLIGRSQRRFKMIGKRISWTVPDSDKWTPEQAFAAHQYEDALNTMIADNKLRLVYDKRW